MELQSGTPIAQAVTRSVECFERGDIPGGDFAYESAVDLADAGTPLWTELTADHVSTLLRLERNTLASHRCDDYLSRVPPPRQLILLVLRAEIWSAGGHHHRADIEAAEVRAMFAIDPEQDARLSRLQGLAAAHRGDPARAKRLLSRALRLFADLEHASGTATVERDLRLISVEDGNESAVGEVLSGGQSESLADRLLIARALKHQLRYEEALLVLERAERADLDPGLRWPLLREMTILLHLTRQHEEAERLHGALVEAASQAADPVAAKAELAGLFEPGMIGAPGSPQVGDQVQHARRLVTADHLDQAGRLLDGLRPSTRTAPDLSLWYLASGELAMARANRQREKRSRVRPALSLFERAVEHSYPEWLTEIRVHALRELGRAHIRLGDEDRAASCWAEAHRLEEGIAERQITPGRRIAMLHAVQDEHDERIQAAVRVLDRVRGARRIARASAGIVVAMEAARGAMILEHVLPGGARLARDLPPPSRLRRARRWLRGIGRGLPPSLVVWLLYADTDYVHHAIVGRKSLHYDRVPCAKKELAQAIKRFTSFWDESELDRSVRSGRFTECLETITRLIGPGMVVPHLPPGTRRIAVVAGGVLSDVPFAALAAPDLTEPLGMEFAISDLPCLSALRPLRRRANRLRGDSRLVVRPPAVGLVPGADPEAATVLEGDRATLDGLRDELAGRSHRMVRIDCHGQFDPQDPAESWMSLAPGGSAGRLRPGDLEKMDLSGCGTLMLGACKSGMAVRVGRDERLGFVRSAIAAGTPSVLAARWVALDAVAGPLLDRFEQYVTHLERDVALQQAQRDVWTGALQPSHDVLQARHPASWACWTLYGDPGRQTGTLRWERRRNAGGEVR